MNEWKNERTNERMNGWMNECMGERKEWSKEGRKNILCEQRNEYNSEFVNEWKTYVNMYAALCFDVFKNLYLKNNVLWISPFVSNVDSIIKYY